MQGTVQTEEFTLRLKSAMEDFYNRERPLLPERTSTLYMSDYDNYTLLTIPGHETPLECQFKNACTESELLHGKTILFCLWRVEEDETWTLLETMCSRAYYVLSPEAMLNQNMKVHDEFVHLENFFSATEWL